MMLDVCQTDGYSIVKILLTCSAAKAGHSANHKRITIHCDTSFSDQGCPVKAGVTLDHFSLVVCQLPSYSWWASVQYLHTQEPNSLANSEHHYQQRPKVIQVWISFFYCVLHYTIIINLIITVQNYCINIIITLLVY